MKIAVSADGKTLESKVSESFGACEYLLIVDVDDRGIKPACIKAVYTGKELGKNVLENDCEVIITGKLDPEEFNLFADAYVTRYSGAGYTAADAIDLMGKSKLDLIRSLEGAGGCSGSHHD